MFKCFECGNVFDHGEERRVVEGSGEETLCCPACGSAYEEVTCCKNCGVYHFEDYLYNGWCADCIGKTSTMNRMMQYVDENGLAADFYIGEFFKSSVDYASPELVDLARCAFRKAVFKDTFDQIDVGGNVPTGFESKYVIMLREFIFNDQFGLYDFAEWMNKRGIGP